MPSSLIHSMCRFRCQEEPWLSCLYFVCCPGASVIQMIMEMEEREPGEMHWAGFLPGGGTSQLQEGLLGSDREQGRDAGDEYVAFK